MLGTDYPFPLGELEPGKLIESMEEFDAETKVHAFYFMDFFLFSSSNYVWFQSTLICDIKEQGIFTLNILRIVTRSPEILVNELLKDQKKFKSWKST